MVAIIIILISVFIYMIIFGADMNETKLERLRKDKEEIEYINKQNGGKHFEEKNK